MDFIKLSKEISYALRHAPSDYQLELDEHGWILIQELLKSLRMSDEWKHITEDDLIYMVKHSKKKRHEILNGKIRALYGHTIHNKIILEKKQPPKVLYHGTSRRSIDKIKLNGLFPMERQYVHLSIDIETAVRVGKRHDVNPVILIINSKIAYEDGIQFYQGNDEIWLSDSINSKYIDFNFKII